MVGVAFPIARPRRVLPWNSATRPGRDEATIGEDGVDREANRPDRSIFLSYECRTRTRPHPGSAMAVTGNIQLVSIRDYFASLRDLGKGDISGPLGAFPESLRCGSALEACRSDLATHGKPCCTGLLQVVTFALPKVVPASLGSG